MANIFAFLYGNRDRCNRIGEISCGIGIIDESLYCYDERGVSIRLLIIEKFPAIIIETRFAAI